MQRTECVKRLSVRRGEVRERLEKRHFAALVELGKTENNCVQQADIHAQLGDTDQAIRCLEQALTLGDPGLSQLLIDGKGFTYGSVEGGRAASRRPPAGASGSTLS